MRFRQYPVALCADIESMFMQISVTQSDWDALRFLWWPDGNLDASPKIYNMTRHVFGLTSSPGCATFALRKTAEDFGSQYSDATSRTVGRDFYVNDLLASLPSIDEAASLAHEVKALVRRIQPDEMDIQRSFSHQPPGH
jgi:hypothetical protein